VKARAEERLRADVTGSILFLVPLLFFGGAGEKIVQFIAM
jgi:hypothetical protein